MAIPEVISVSNYLKEVRDDISSPTTSTFVSKMLACKNTAVELEENLEKDKDSLLHMKKSVKKVYNQGQTFVSAEQEMGDALDKLGNGGWWPDELALACRKFAYIIQEHAQLLQTLLTNQKTNILSPLDSILKGDMKGVKGDLRRPFEKAAKEYDAKFSKIEKERKQQEIISTLLRESQEKSKQNLLLIVKAKELGFLKDDLEPPEVAEDMSKERKNFQLSMCDYLGKVNSIKTKKAVEFLQKLVEYYHAYCKYFEEGLKTWTHFGTYVTELSTKLKEARLKQEEERIQINDTKAIIISSLSSDDLKAEVGQTTTSASVYSLHQQQGNKIHGTAKSGYLYKKSEGKVRKVWQKRRCEVKEGKLFIHHSDESKAPVTVALLTCQVKVPPDEKKCFDLVSYNRTYHLMCDDEVDTSAWVSVLLNAKEGALKEAFREGSSNSPSQDSFREIQQRIISYVKNLPGNNRCCDCNGTNDVSWLSTNYGIIVCIECSGIHRDLGVHVSRIQSLTLDKVGTAQLLLARHMSNSFFNEIAEAANPQKPDMNSSMEQRRDFIQSKYVKRKFIKNLNLSPEEKLKLFRDSIERQDLKALLNVYFQGADLDVGLTPLKESPLHLAVYQEDGFSLPVVDFLIQNSGSVDLQTKEGNTPLHYCVIYNKIECLRLLLRVGANPNIDNNNGKTPLDIAQERHALNMVDMIKEALLQKKNMFENIEYEWNLSDDNATDVSDDEDRSRNGLCTPERKLRPTSLVSDRLGPVHHPESPRIHRGLPEHRPTLAPSNISASISSLNMLSSSGFKRPTSATVRSDYGRQSDYGRHSTFRSDKPPPPPPIATKPACWTGSLRKRQAPYPPAVVSSKPPSGGLSDYFLPRASPVTHIPKRASGDSIGHTRTPSDSIIGPIIPHLQRTSTFKPSYSVDSSTGCKSPLPVNKFRRSPGHRRSPSSESTHSFNFESTEPSIISAASSNSNLRQSLSTINSSTNTISEQGSILYDTRDHGGGHTTDTSPSSSPQESHVTLINGRSSESLSSLLSEGDNPRRPPRQGGGSIRRRRCRALYDCDGDREDELSFREGEVMIIIVEETEDGDCWMECQIQGEPLRRGKVPVNFVHMLAD